MTTYAALLVLLLSVQDKKDDRKEEPKKDDTPAKIVGLWELIKDDGDEEALGAKLDLRKDGTVAIHLKVNGRSETLDGGEYKVENGKFTWFRGRDPKQGPADVAVIRKLTDEELILKDELKQRTMTFRRAKKPAEMK